MTTKYTKYQDYVIKDGKFIGEFEEMYADFADPWEQSITESFASEKAIALNTISAFKPQTVIELGYGLGHFTKRIKELGVPTVIGVDISPTAIKKAAAHAPDITFRVADVLNFRLLEEYRPDIIVMAEITWYILEKLPTFLDHIKRNFPNSYLIHLLATYPPAEQKHGCDYFTSLDEILTFFQMNYLEWGEIVKPLHGNIKRTFFVGRYAPLDSSRLVL